MDLEAPLLEQLTLLPELSLTLQASRLSQWFRISLLLSLP
jgi:hypothetical protein